MNENVISGNSNVRTAEKQSKTALFSLLLGIVSLLLGLLPALLGLLIKILKALFILPFEGTLGIGGLLGIFSIVVGLPLALIALWLGRKTGKKIESGLAQVNDRTRARIGVSLALATLVGVPLLCVFILLLSDFLFLYQVQHFLSRQGIARPNK